MGKIELGDPHMASEMCVLRSIVTLQLDLSMSVSARHQERDPLG